MSKKTRKSMESSSIRIYLLIVKRLLLNNFSVIAASLLSLIAVSSVEAGTRSCFVVFSANSNLEIATKNLEKLGARIRQVVPPQIVKVDLPDNIIPADIPSVASAYFGIIPMSELKTMGIMEKAAGIQWNKDLLSENRNGQNGTIGTMGVSMQAAIDETLFPPDSLAAKIEDNKIHVSWISAPGALTTEVQVSKQPDFSDVLAAGKTGLNSLAFPLLPSSERLIYYVRARSADRPNVEDRTADIIGNWTAEILVQAEAFNSVNDLVAPTLTSPLDNYQSIGFTLILEWASSGATSSRIQLSSSKAFSNPWLDVVVDDKSFIVPSSALHLNEPVYWRVMSYGSHSSSWSNIRRFSVKEPKHAHSDVFVNPEAPR